MAQETSNLAFIGGRGAGKSRLSRKFGKQCGRAVFSTDTLISYEAGGLSISSLVEKSGWKDFRDREFLILQKLAPMRNVIIDCGGGILVEAPEDESTPETFSRRKANLLKESALVVYVQRDMDWLLRKAVKNADRPDLIGPYREILERRLPWYEQTADFVLDMNRLGTQEALEILNKRFS